LGHQGDQVVPKFEITTPEGRKFQVTAPDGVSQDEVLAKVRAQTETTAPRVDAPPELGKDIVGRAKEALTKEPPAGERHGYFQFGPDLGPAVRGAGRFLLPGSVPSAVTQGIMGLPGKGIAPLAARVLGSGGAGAAIGAAQGKDPTSTALEQGGTALFGEALGAAGRAGARAAQSAFSKTTEKVGDLIGQFVPAFAGKSPKETISRVVSGEGQKALQKEYSDVVDGVIQKSGNPMIAVPSLARLGRPGPDKKNPGIMTAQEAWTSIESLSRSLRGATGAMSRRKGALDEVLLLDKARQEFYTNLNPSARTAFDEAGRQYARGKAVERWLGRGRETLTEASERKLIQGGKLSEPILEERFRSRLGELKAVFTPEEFGALELAVRRGERDPLAITKPGQLPSMGWHPGSLPYIHLLPHAPQRVGQPEITADQVARALRVLGQRGAAQAVE
jgi:hypothetical protein